LKALVIDCAISKLSIAAKNEDKVCVTSYDIGMKQSEILVSAIDYVLKTVDLTTAELNYTAITIGPGSFTGIRACVTVARMLAQQLNIKAIGISSLEILSKILDGESLVALDARKNKAYLYDGEIKGAIELEEVDKIIFEKHLVTDNSLLERFQKFTQKSVSYQQKEYPLGEILAKLALDKIAKGVNTDWGCLKPLYIQPPPVFK
jgi:tRNA threonylcarbamoyladenosine biosynthesis protein TsaB